ncbi:DNA phosphorothioation system restriction enzyme [Natronocella acetinitrilica]|uniref:DNA phosphorothioation system restriction enzyme n=1 Tax=Natronocella acetinitrilica TaxID=414046 RepID=A0AAE3KDA5_9GAMM|nr:DEAD/DEAH box helicase family protein [Natronocella acetinitrilica]MCP1676639.1 DNA phosphorothioation system restriction enzyme [Natronocella acetinitrilica]
MNLSSLTLPFYVSTTEQDPISTFFVPVFGQAASYDVAVGYFSSQWLRDAAYGIAKFALNGGHARWIIAPTLSDEDRRVLSENWQDAESVLNDRVSVSFQTLYEELTQHTREALGWLIKDGIISFRVGFPYNNLHGIMHAKQGVFRDTLGNEVAFLGSYNLTGGAGTNWEAFSVFCSWSSEESHARIEEIGKSFDRMWEGRDENLLVKEPHAVDLEPFVRSASAVERHYELISTIPNGPYIPDKFLDNGKLRPYQEDGINKWFSNNGRGILHMATGTGKTVTALTALTRLCHHCQKRGAGLFIIITVPYQHLAEQWASEAAAFGFEPILCYGGVVRWIAEAQRQVNEIQLGLRPQCMFITVNATMRDRPFQNLVSNMRANIVFVGDEMHNLGARTSLQALPEKAGFRMGLSATPERAGDLEGTEALQEYFGDEVLSFGLDKAIEGGYLCEYYYYPILVYLTEEENKEYEVLSRAISQAYHRNSSDSIGSNDYLKRLLIKRSRLVGKAENKLPTLLDLLGEKTSWSHTLVYCGDSSDNGERYIDRALRAIGKQLGVKANKFTAGEGREERRRLLADFSEGRLEVLLAIRCLDEGVDIPSTQTAFILASSANPKEFVQRRGRVLRRAPGKDKATLYDFITVPNVGGFSEQGDLSAERGLLKRELMRFNEFAELAINYGEALDKMRDMKVRLNLLDL